MKTIENFRRAVDVSPSVRWEKALRYPLVGADGSPTDDNYNYRKIKLAKL